MPRPRPMEERFWDKVHHEPNSGCWLWAGTVTVDGYGLLFFPRNGPKRKKVLAHRYSCQIHGIELPTHLELDHLCRVRCCVNPSHMELVTHKENIMRGIGPTAVNARKTHCVNGHEFTPENTISILSNGTSTRRCRACGRIRGRKRWAARRGAERLTHVESA